MRGKGATRLGVVGFCWGGLGLKVHVQEPDLFDAVVMCHPTGVSVDDFKAVKKPLLLVCAQGKQSSFTGSACLRASF